MPISQSTLTNKSYSYREHVFESMKKSATAKAVRSAFLCHSHKDEQLVKGLFVLFEENGVELYIDWKDHSMPETPNAETARKIQSRIKQCDIFLFLATANSKASRWCPWEIGYADSSNKGIYIIPTSDGLGSYGNEYLELYSKIDVGQTDQRSGYAVYKAGAGNGQWLSSGALK